MLDEIADALGVPRDGWDSHDGGHGHPAVGFVRRGDAWFDSILSRLEWTGADGMEISMRVHPGQAAETIARMRAAIAVLEGGPTAESERAAVVAGLRRWATGFPAGPAREAAEVAAMEIENGHLHTSDAD